MCSPSFQLADFLEMEEAGFGECGWCVEYSIGGHDGLGVVGEKLIHCWPPFDLLVLLCHWIAIRILLLPVPAVTYHVFDPVLRFPAQL